MMMMMMIIKIMIKVPRKACHDHPKKKCKYVPKQECHYEPREKCKKHCGHIYRCGQITSSTV